MSLIPIFSGRKHSKNTNNTTESMNMDIWDPLEAISFTTLPVLTSQAFATANLDWKETADAHVFMTDLPGMKKDDVKIEVEEEKVLKISGERSRANEEKGEKWHRIERGNEKFFKTVRLPQNTNMDGVKAVLDNGVLTVTVLKEREAKSYGRLIPIAN